MSENRDPETGQFTSLSDHYAAEHSRLEFEPMPNDKRPEDDWPVYGSSDDEIRRAAAEMQERRGVQVEEVDEIGWKDRDGNPLGNVSATAEQNADALTKYRETKAAAAQEAQDRELKAAIDNPRIEMAVLEPDVAAKYENKQEIERAVGEFHTQMTGEPPPAHTVETNTQPAATPDGLDQQPAFAMSHPQVREAIEVELSRAHQAQADYEAKISEANNWARASLVHEFQELGRLPVDQWENALMTIQAQDPVRFQKGVGVINQVQRVSAEQARIQNEHAARAQQMESARQQQLADWTRVQGERYEKWAQREGLDMNTFAPAASKYVQDHLGMSRDQFAQVLRDNPALRSSEFQQVLSDATRYRQAQEARKNVERAPLPPAIRPGQQPPGASSHSNAAKIAELNRALSNATGMAAIRIASQLTSLRRKG
jgi:hypothetical protein